NSFFFQAEDGIRDFHVTGVQTCALPICDCFEDECVADVMERIVAALNTGNWDRSDIQTDYFDVGHYVDLRIGTWDKPFVYKPEQIGRASRRERGKKKAVRARVKQTSYST